MFNVVLVEPEIPPNTGNVIRLCANSGARLHLIEPLGFDLSDKQLRRAGLDYHEYADLQVHTSFEALVERERPPAERMFCFTTRASRPFNKTIFQPGDWLVFGAETRGLAPELREGFPPERRLRLPMREGNRSLNLSNAVAVVVYEAWRQSGFLGGR
jgi:tRNA (cytidine/uridine-2'-O-)-methyltransferase